ncbi:hypothetical protein D3C87_2144790 [compost metagenome]
MASCFNDFRVLNRCWQLASFSMWLSIWSARMAFRLAEIDALKVRTFSNLFRIASGMITPACSYIDRRFSS